MRALIAAAASLDRKLETLRAFGRWSDDEIERFGSALKTSSSDWELFRINPLDFAGRHGFDPNEVTHLFVHGVRIGLFDLVWSTVCVFCSAVEYTFDTIDRVPRESFHCTRCGTDIYSWLDERVEASFSIHPSVATLSLDPFADIASYERHYTSPSVVHLPETSAYLARAQRGHVLVPAEGTGVMDVVLPHMGSLRLISFDRHAELLVSSDPALASCSREHEVEVLPASFAPSRLGVPSGDVRIRLVNRAPLPTGVIALEGDAAEFRHSVETHRARLGRYLSGQMLLCNESFRTLFRVQTLDEELALNVRHVTLLFTDLTRSTQLYDRVGDAAAYGRIRSHFRALHAATGRHTGAIVKTMGDAVMAVFSTPRDAVRAAIEMHARTEEMNRAIVADGFPLGLKVGIHAGTAIVVHAEGRLDYFGQTVNVAARVGALAHPGSICLTEEVRSAPEVADILASAGGAGDMASVSVRGLASEMLVCQFTPRPGMR